MTFGGATTASRRWAAKWRSPKSAVSPRSSARRAPQDWSRRRPEAMARPDRLYRVLVRLYPAEFRDEYAREMAQVRRDRARHESPVRLWVDLARDLILTAPKEHRHVLLTDLRYTFRLIRRAPLFTAAVVATVALAIA